MSRTKQLFALLLCLCLLCPLAATRASAAGTDAPELTYELTADGDAVRTGDVITVTFRLLRADGSEEAYRLRTLQNEIVYDQEFFEYVDGSAKVLKSGGSVLFQTRIDGTHIIKASYLSEFGGEFSADEAFCSFQLRVIAEGGSGWIANDSANAMAFGETGEALSVAAGDDTTDATGTDAVHAGVIVTSSRFLNAPNGSARVPLLLTILFLVLLALALVAFSAFSPRDAEDGSQAPRVRRALTVALVALLLASALCAWMLIAAW